MAHTNVRLCFCLYINICISKKMLIIWIFNCEFGFGSDKAAVADCLSVCLPARFPFAIQIQINQIVECGASQRNSKKLKPKNEKKKTSTFFTLPLPFCGPLSIIQYEFLFFYSHDVFVIWTDQLSRTKCDIVSSDFFIRNICLIKFFAMRRPYLVKIIINNVIWVSFPFFSISSIL